MGIEHLDPSERAYGEVVQSCRATLLSLLTEDERTTKKVQKTSGRTYPWSFEDSARQIISDGVDPRKDSLHRALTAYQSSVNEFWSYIYRERIPEYVVGQWFRKYRKHKAKGLDRNELEAEAIFMLRDAIRRWNPNEGVPFKIYACRVVLDDLTAWVRQHWSVVDRPRSEKRGKYIPQDDSLDIEMETFSQNDSSDQEEKDDTHA